MSQSALVKHDPLPPSEIRALDELQRLVERLRQVEKLLRLNAEALTAVPGVDPRVVSERLLFIAERVNVDNFSNILALLAERDLRG